jgi:hypothetical protein
VNAVPTDGAIEIDLVNRLLRIRGIVDAGMLREVLESCLSNSRAVLRLRAIQLGRVLNIVTGPAGPHPLTVRLITNYRRLLDRRRNTVFRRP